MIPDYSQWLSQTWGWTNESVVALSCASNVVIGSNPAYTAADFLGMYPKFGGTLANVQGTFASGSSVVVDTGTDGLAAGQVVTGAPVAPGTLIQSIDSTTQFTLSKPAIRSGSLQVGVFATPLIPAPALNAYIALASASLVQARWLDSWVLGMALYVAHFVTLWLRSDGDVYSTAGQAAAAGIARGITVSASAGPLSEGIQPVTGLESWGHWNQTEYGVQFASIAKIIGGGPMFLW